MTPITITFDDNTKQVLPVDSVYVHPKLRDSSSTTLAVPKQTKDEVLKELTSLVNGRKITKIAATERSELDSKTNHRREIDPSHRIEFIRRKLE